MVNTGELVITFLAGEKDRRGQMPSVSSMGDNERWRGVVEQDKQDKQDPREVRAGMMLQMIMSKDQKGGLAQTSVKCQPSYHFQVSWERTRSKSPGGPSAHSRALSPLARESRWRGGRIIFFYLLHISPPSFLSSSSSPESC